MWLLTPAADRLFRKAKERVYRIDFEAPQPAPTTQNPTAPAPAAHAKLVAVLEENPKWKLLRKVLDEIKQDYDSTKQAQNDNDGPCSVLVMVKDERTLDTVKSYLVGEKKQTLSITWSRFLEHQNDRSRALTSGNEGITGHSQEWRLLMEKKVERDRSCLVKGQEKAPNLARS
jgi:DNA excision repair protein ERCC-4